MAITEDAAVGGTAPVELDISVGDRSLHVVRYGTGGPHVVFEAGGGCASDVWSAVQKLLPEFTTWSYDRAGEGASAPNGDWSLSGSVSDLKAWLEAAGIPGPFFFVAHSLGCHIVRTYAQNNPGATSQMLLVDARPPNFERKVQDSGIAVPTPPLESSFVKEVTIADDVVAHLPAPSGVRTVVVSCERLDGLPDELTSDEKATVERMWRQEQDALAQSVAQASAEVAPGTGHMVPLEAPEYVAAAIRDMIAAESR